MLAFYWGKPPAFKALQNTGGGQREGISGARRLNMWHLVYVCVYLPQQYTYSSSINRGRSYSYSRGFVARRNQTQCLLTMGGCGCDVLTGRYTRVAHTESHATNRMLSCVC